jgi:DinB superfamily
VPRLHVAIRPFTHSMRTMDQNDALRTHLARLLDWQDAHAGFDAIVEGIPPDRREAQPEGLPYSPWQLLEHMRLTQRDILEFCRDPAYAERTWPNDYWPASAAPPTPQAWDESVAAFRADREELKRLAADPGVDLFAAVPHGTGQTYLREVLLVADHSAYHLGELVVLRRLLGLWTSG